MKKILLLLLTFMLSFTLYACDPEEDPNTDPVDPITCEEGQEEVDGECVDIVIPLTDAELVEEAKDALDLGDLSAVTEDILLPSEGINETVITWSSSNTFWISIDGVVTRPQYSYGDMPVQLTATITLNDESVEKVFEVTIIKIPVEQEVATDVATLDFFDQTIVTENLNFPVFGSRGTVFYFSSSNPDVINKSGIVFRPGYTEEDAEVTITLNATIGQYSEIYTFDFTVPKMPAPEVSETISMPFISLATEWTLEDGTLDIHYLNEGNIPYVNIQDFINVLNGAIESEEMLYDLTGDVFTMSYIYEAEDELDEDYTLINTFDFSTNIMTVNTMAFFGGLTSSTSSDFGGDLVTVDSTATDPIEVVVDFDDYNMQVANIGGMLYMPFHLANFFYSGSMFNTYYNGEEILAIDAWQMDTDEVIAQMEDTALVDEEMPDDMRKFTYHFLALSFDLIYGLKEVKEIESGHDYLSNYMKTMILGDDDDLSNAMKDAQYGLDDPHSGYLMTGYYDGVRDLGLSINDIGPRWRAMVEYSWQDHITDYCGSFTENVSYEVNADGTIAVVNITGFSLDAVNDTDTAKEFGEKLAQIQNLGTVESIVIDLSCNGGGTIGIALQVLGYVTDDPITVYSKNPTDLTEETWTTTSTVDALTGIDWYIMTSPSTFSAANLVTSIASDQGLATIIGRQSSGGACSVAYIYLPDGSIINMSSDWMLTNDQFESIEFGIPVDVSASNLVNNDGTINFDKIEEIVANNQAE